MTDALKHIGDTLKSAREAKGLELKDIADVLKIRRLYLDAMEKGDPAELPGLVYFEGYLRTYAKLLGLEEDVLFDSYQDYLGSTLAKEIEDRTEKKLTMVEKIKLQKKKHFDIFK